MCVYVCFSERRSGLRLRSCRNGPKPALSDDPTTWSSRATSVNRTRWVPQLSVLRFFVGCLFVRPCRSLLSALIWSVPVCFSTFCLKIYGVYAETKMLSISNKWVVSDISLFQFTFFLLIDCTTVEKRKEKKLWFVISLKTTSVDIFDSDMPYLSAHILCRIRWLHLQK